MASQINSGGHTRKFKSFKSVVNFISSSSALLKLLRGKAPLEFDLDLELSLAENHIGLSETAESEFDSFIICLLQYFSKKPWISLQIEENEIIKYTTEWGLLTQDIKVQNLEFLSKLRETKLCSSPHVTNYQQIMQLFYQYFKRSFQVNVFIGQTSENGNMELSLESTLAMPNHVNLSSTNSEIIKIFKTSKVSSNRKLGYFRLISKHEDLFPDPFNYAKEVVDQLIRFEIVKELYSQNESKVIGSYSDPTNIIIFQQLNQQLDKLTKCMTFRSIFEILFPPEEVGSFFILQNLESVEPKLTIQNKTELRIELINHIATEILFPLRKAVTAEKEAFELKSYEMVERQKRLQLENERLKASEQTHEKEITQLEKLLKSSKSDSMLLANEGKQNAKLHKEQTEKMVKLKLQLEDIKEAQSFCNFLNKLGSLHPDIDVLEKILALPKGWNTSWTLSKIIRYLLKVLKLSWPEYLEARIRKDLKSDKQQLIQTILAIQEMPKISTDHGGTLHVKGNHIVIGSILPNVVKAIELDSSIKEIQIIARGNVLINSNIKLPGMNLVILGRNIIIQGIKVCVNTTGTDGRKCKYRKADDGGFDGADGIDGDNGMPGGNGGDIYMEAIESLINLEHLIIKCSGGSGAKGQNGGNGQDGLDGADGVDAQISNPTWSDSYFDSFNFIKRGILGKPGMCGGIGGKGGLGGEGGNPGKVTFASSNCSKTMKSSVKVICDRGKVGENGSRGRAGTDGKHGYHGKDHGWGKAGSWSSSVDKRGYELWPKPISGWLFTGYEIIEGSEPHKSKAIRHNNNKSSKNKNQNHRNTRFKPEKKKNINLDEISSLKESILLLNCETNAKDKELTSQASKLKNTLSKETQKSKQMDQNEAQILIKQKNQKKATVDLELKRNTANQHIRNIQASCSSNESKIKVAKEEEALANTKISELEQLALGLQNKESEVKVAAESQLQQQLEMQSKHERQCNYESNDEMSDDDGESSKKQIYLSIEKKRQVMNLDMDLFLKVTNGLSHEWKTAIECCIQTVIATTNMSSFTDTGKTFLENIDTYRSELGDEFIYKYIKDTCSDDIIISEKFSKNTQIHEIIKEYNQDSLFQLIYNLRFGKVLDFKYESILNFDQSLVDVFQEIQDVEILNQSISKWIEGAEETGKEGLFQKLKNYLPSTTAVITEDLKRSLLGKAKELYSKKLKFILSIDLTKFLQEFIHNISSSSSTDINFEEILNKIISSNGKYNLKKICDILENPVMYEFHAIQIIRTISQLHMKINELDEVQLQLWKLQDTNDNNIDETIISSIEKLQSEIYTKYKVQFLEPEQLQIDNHYNNTNSKMKELVSKFINLIESKYLRLTYTERISMYQSFKGKLGSWTPTDSYVKLQEYYNESLHKYMTTYNKNTPNELKDCTNYQHFISVLENILYPRFKLKKYTREVERFIYFFLDNSREFTSIDINKLEEVEKIVWNHLSSHNLSASTNLQIILESKLELDYEPIKAIRYNLEFMKDISEQIQERLFKFVPIPSQQQSHKNKGEDASNDDESRIIETNKTRKFIKFYLLKIQLMLCTNGKCSDISKLLDKVQNTYIEGPTFIFNLLETYCNEYINIQKKYDSTIDYLQYLNQEFEEVTDYYTCYLETLDYIEFNDDDTKEDLSTIQDSIDELKGKMDMKIHSETIKPDDKVQLQYFKMVLLSLVEYNKDFPIASLRGQLARQENQYRRMETMFSIIDDNFNKLKSSSSIGGLFILVRYTKFIITQILDNLTLENINEMELILQNDIWIQIGEELKQSIKVPSDHHKVVVGKVWKIIAPNKKFPFQIELDLLIGAFWPTHSECTRTTSRERVEFQIMKWYDQLSRNTSPTVGGELWILFINKLKELKPKSSHKNNLQVLLAEWILNIHDPNSSIKLFVLRLLYKQQLMAMSSINSVRDSLKHRQISKLSKINNLNQSVIFETLFPSSTQFNFKVISTNLLIESEINLLQRTGIVTEMATDVELRQVFISIFIKINPADWYYSIEKIIFNHLYNKYHELSDIQQPPRFYTQLKQSYFLIGSENRPQWLQLMEKLYDLIKYSHVEFSEDELKLIFKYSVDLTDIASLQKIIYTKFPCNIIYSILEECIVEDLGFILFRKVGQDDDDDNILTTINDVRIAIIEYIDHGRSVDNYMELDKTKVNFLQLVHVKLLQETKLIDKDVMVDPALVIKLFTSMNSCHESLSSDSCSKDEVEGIYVLLQETPISYWPRILRKLVFKSLNINSVMIDSLCGMDVRFNENLVDKLINVFESFPPLSEDDEDELKQLLISNFNSTKWVFDEEALTKLVSLLNEEDIQNSNDINGLKLEIKSLLKAYSKELRSKELSVTDLVSWASNTIGLNQGEQIRTELSLIERNISQIKQLLADKYKIDSQLNQVARDQLKDKIPIWIKELQDENKFKWRHQLPSDNVVYKLIAIIYRAVELHFLTIDIDKPKPPRNVQLMALLLFINGIKPRSNKHVKQSLGRAQPTCEIETDLEFKQRRVRGSDRYVGFGEISGFSAFERIASETNVGLTAIEQFFGGVGEMSLLSGGFGEMKKLMKWIDENQEGTRRSETEQYGRIGEIYTGEGKSLIVAMFAAFLGILGANVNIITSNKVLAEEDASGFKEFYKTLNLTVSNNCDSECKSDGDRKKRYNANIIYGEVGGFQADLLNTEFYLKDIARTRVDIIIVDEVDSLLLDKGSNMLYLSHDIPELKHLKMLFLVIWQAVQATECNPDKRRPYSDNDLNAVRISVEKVLRQSGGSGNEIVYPKCLKEFIDERLGVWIKQAFRARFMPINEDFILDTESGHKIINMDKDTGVEQANMQFSFGLQQFLQLRYGSKMSPESLKCVFMSNLCYFNRYRGHVFGLSGTLGGQDECDLLAKKYHVDFFGLPRFKLNKCIEKSPSISGSEIEWLSGIVESIRTHSTQPGLIICENIAILEKLRNHLVSNGLKPTVYKSSEKDTKVLEEATQEGGLKAGTLILSTNLAGRGTDLSIHADVRKGLHVILTFMPTNMRVEKQAFGRTARSGRNGTVQFVLLLKNQHNNTSINQVKEIRQKQELKRLEIIKSRDIPRIQLEDDLFTRYNDFVNKQIRNSSHFNQYPKRLRKLQLKCLNNRWAIWLDSIRSELDLLYLQNETGRESILFRYKIFKNDILDILRSSKYNSNVFAQFPSELVHLGMVHERIATKSILNTLTNADFDEFGEICGETYEKVTCTLRSGWKFIVGGEEGRNEVLDMISDYLKRPSNLEIGLATFTQAHHDDKRFTEAASAYQATVQLQIDSKSKRFAKKKIMDAIKKIRERMEVNVTCLTLLETANICRRGRGQEIDKFVEGVKFKAQINSEINLFQHHINSMSVALHSELLPSSFRILKDVDTNLEAEQIFNKIFLHLEKKGLMKGHRLSKKLIGEDGNLEILLRLVNHFLEIQSGEQHDSDEIIKQALDNLPGLIIANKIKLHRTIERRLCKRKYDISVSDFTSSVITKATFITLLKPEIIPENAEVKHIYIINVNIQNTESIVKFPQELQIHKDSIIILLSNKNGEIYDPGQLFTKPIQEKRDSTNPEATDLTLQEQHVHPYLELTDSQVGTLTEFLISEKWIKLEQSCIEINTEYLMEHFDMDTNKLDWETLPYKLSPFHDIITNLVLEEDLSFKQEIQFNELPFPTEQEDGAKEIFEILVRARLIKKPKICFPTQYERSDIETRLKNLKLAVEEIKPELKETYLKFHGRKELEDKDFECHKARIDNEFETQYYNRILDILINSIGSLKRHPKIRVNYSDLSSLLSLDTHQFNDELNELQKEGIFDRIFTFDESIRWYENPATLVLMLGIGEIALGVTLEFLSSGILSPLAQFLISEGGSDVVYSIKDLYKGRRLDGSNYWDYKKESMLISACTLGLGIGGGALVKASTTLFRAIGTTLLVQLALSGGKAMLQVFIENNMDKAVEGNMIGLGSLLDEILKTQQFEDEMKEFQRNAKKLYMVSFGKGQCEEILVKMINIILIDESNANTSSSSSSTFQLRLGQMLNRIQPRIGESIMRRLYKSTMPIHSIYFQGIFGQDHKGIMNCANEITELCVTTMKHINAEIERKISMLQSIREELDVLLRDEMGGGDGVEFEEFLSGICSKIRVELKKTIIRSTYTQLCTPGMKKKMYDNFNSTYGSCWSFTGKLDSIFSGTVIEDVFSDKRNEDEVDYCDDNTSLGGFDGSIIKHKLVRNAAGRTGKDVSEIFKGFNQPIEFIEDNVGNVYVNLNSDASPMLCTHYWAVDLYIWNYNNNNSQILTSKQYSGVAF